MESKNIKLQRLYDDLAYLWPLLSPSHEYAEEAVYWRIVLREKLGPGKHPILELGVGGGHNLSFLTNDFDATAVDISEKMLEHSKRLNPKVEHHVGDMRHVRLWRKFAAVLIHDAISYMLSEADLRATFATASAHLQPGGIFITTPDNFRETFTSPKIEHSTHSNDEMQLTYFEYAHDPDPNDTIMELIMVYFIREKGSLRIEHDRHIMNLFPKSTWARLMKEAGFQFEEHSFHLKAADMEYIMLIGTLQ